MAAPRNRAVREWLMEDEAQRLLTRLNNGITQLIHRVELLEILVAPKREDRMFEKPFQRVLVPAGQELEAYRQEVPKGDVGIITRIGNDWFPLTTLKRFIDNSTMESAIQRVIAPVDNPMGVKIFVKDQVTWTARNDDAIPHTFNILTDGFFVPRDVYERVIAVEG